MRVNVIASKCVGCKGCELACSVVHLAEINPKRARLKVTYTHPLPSAPKVCRQCPRPKCVDACPTGALRKGADRVNLDQSLCTGCGACVEACPFNSIFLDPVDGLALKCDLCGGDPACVKYCKRGALVIKE